MIVFDDDVAARLAAGARDLGDLLRDQSSTRAEAAEEALHGFACMHRSLFEEAVETEAVDRTMLAHRLGALAQQVDRTRAAAERERQRQAGLAAQEEHPAEPPSPLSASFSARSRRRTSAPAAVRGSADPTRLRSFVERARTSDGRVRALLDEVAAIWRRFGVDCSWAPTGRVTVFDGVRELLDENGADADWMERVATAFDAAGGEALSSMAVELASAPVLKLSDPVLLTALATLDPQEVGTVWAARPELQEQLLALDSAGVNRWWHGLDAEPGALSRRQSVLLDACPSFFGTLEGIPYGARDRANRVSLSGWIDALTAERDAALFREEELEDRPEATTLEIAAAAFAITAANERLRPLLSIQGSLTPVPGSSARLLCSLTADSPPSASVSIGDLDTATTVVYTVAGAGTTTDDMESWTTAARRVADLLPAESAVVAWIGDDTPPPPDGSDLDRSVLSGHRAERGGRALARALRGLAAVRHENPVVPALLAHSSGSTTTALALLEENIPVDAVVTPGSAELPRGEDGASHPHAATVSSPQTGDVAIREEGGGDAGTRLHRRPFSEHPIDPGAEPLGGRRSGAQTGVDAGRALTDLTS
ncbi:alpha/beta hydrolase [Rathayibacter tanaceti]|uniref:DUF1023 domain-containing protein n=2 Tax=Rathayibacter tanaceti TaxID=1671680 RepID=A0A162G1I7_9MICO|nr:alpha/beta hydrolase [Rathayibacter tanaceti]KZX22760.1 hypothetical protein ACH61_00114 [Rathayibacter tanaceti]QHC55943.1 hypothetical protein GSU10_10080 [Rathayibacter tanaceti]TCO39218.1 alpha/beta hydrolase family protein [Rathayibacter tanaceti]